jgi:hypothetical protein
MIICGVSWTCGANDAVLIRAAGNKQVMRCQEPGGERCWKVAADRVVLASIWYAGETRLYVSIRIEQLSWAPPSARLL